MYNGFISKTHLSTQWFSSYVTNNYQEKSVKMVYKTCNDKRFVCVTTKPE